MGRAAARRWTFAIKEGLAPWLLKMAQTSGTSPLRLLDLPPGDFAALWQLEIAAEVTKGRRLGDLLRQTPSESFLGPVPSYLHAIAERS